MLCPPGINLSVQNSGSMSSRHSESATASIAHSKSSHGQQEPDPSNSTKKRKRNAEPSDDSDGCITSFLKRVPEVDRHFDIIDVLGDGTFSYVFHGKPKNMSSDASFALKYIIPTSASWRITNEIRYLKRLGGKHHVCDIKCVIRHQDNVVLVLPYFKATKFLKVVQDSNQWEIQKYLKALFEALAHVHRFSVIHRDIKPSNFLYDREKGTFLLVDFGLAEDMIVEDKENKQHTKRKHDQNSKNVLSPFDKSQRSHRPNILRDRSPRVQEKKKSIFSMSKSSSKNSSSKSSKSSSSKSSKRECAHADNEICNTCLLKPGQEASRAGTPGFRSPEMLMKHPQQTTAVDIWAAGVIFLSLLSMRYPFFKAADDLTSLCQIITLLGSDMIISAAKSIGKQVTLSKSVTGWELQKMCTRLRESSHISRCERCDANNVEEDRSKVCPLQPFEDSAFDLLARCLDPNPNSRITAEQVLKHEFFSCNHPPPLHRPKWL